MTALALSRPRAHFDGDAARARVPREWFSWGGSHGGLLMALSAEVVAREAPGKTLRTLTTHFLAPVDDQPMELRSTVERSSSTSATVLVRTEQSGRLAALTVAATLASRPSWAVGHRPAMPAVPSPDACAAYRDAELLFAFPSQIEIRPTDDTLPLSGAERPVLTAWVRVRASDLVDVPTAVMLLDALAPAAYAAWTAPAVMPTVELSAHLVRDLDRNPYQGWVLIQQRHTATEAGISIDECDMFTTDGDLVAQARQLRRVLTSS
jgi:acyl-CoA thioesterase